MISTAALVPTLEEEHLQTAGRPAVNALRTTKRLIWLYFWLLIFEGALRKWFLPGWSNPLLLIRDPVVILIYVFAGIAGTFPRNGFIYWIVGLGVVSVAGSEIGGRGNLLVTLYGFRAHFLHLPLIFLVPNVLDRSDVERMAKWFLLTSIPMCFLVLAQFRAAPDAWINNGAGAVQGGQLEVGIGKIRPPGTFSFTAGLIAYLSMAVAFALHPQMQKDAANYKLSVAALPAVATMVGVSGSRTALGSVALILLGIGLICIKRPSFFGRGIKTVVVLGTAYFLLSSWSEFRQGLEVHQSRLETGGGLKQGMVFRALGELLEPFSIMFDVPFFGAGLGMGTNGASGFLYGRVAFNLGEADWGRIVRESGAIIGLTYIALRIGIVVYLASRALRSLNANNPLPMLLFSATFSEILHGQFGVPSLLGLAVFGGGLCLASNHLTTGAEMFSPLQNSRDTQLPTGKNVRGRSAYAEELHGDIENPDIARFGP